MTHTLYHGFAVLTAQLSGDLQEPGPWSEVARFDNEAEAIRHAHSLRTNDGATRVVDIAELHVLSLRENIGTGAQAGNAAGGTPPLDGANGEA